MKNFNANIITVTYLIATAALTASLYFDAALSDCNFASAALISDLMAPSELKLGYTVKDFQSCNQLVNHPTPIFLMLNLFFFFSLCADSQTVNFIFSPYLERVI